MEARAIAKYVRVSPRKAARLARECVGKRVEDMKPILSFYPQKAAKAVLSVLVSAQSNLLVKSAEIKAEQVVVRAISIDRAPGAKRILYRARGRANRKERKFSHLNVVVGDSLIVKKDKSAKLGAAKAAAETPSQGKNA